MYKKMLALTLSALMLLPVTALAEEEPSTPPATEQPAPEETDCTPIPAEPPAEEAPDEEAPADEAPPEEAPAEETSSAQLVVAASTTANSGKGGKGSSKGNSGKESGGDSKGGSANSSGKGSATSGSLTTSTDENCETPEEPAKNHGQAQRTLAHAKVAAHLAAMLESGKVANPNARANVEAVIAKLIGEGEAADEEEALTTIEESVEAEGEAAGAAELDVLAEAQLRLGKKEKAKATLKLRLKKESRTKAAYEALIKLEQESGEAVDLDTYVGGEKVKFDVRPKVKEGRTLVPIRALVERLGAEISWDEATQTVTIIKGEQEIKLVIGSSIALVNGAEVRLDAAAEIEGGRTLIPARFVSEGLGLYVHWLAEHRTILVTEQPVIEEAPAPAEETTQP